MCYYVFWLVGFVLWVDDVVDSKGIDEAILHEISKDPSASASKIAKSIGITSRTIQRYLIKLQDNKVIARIGPDHGGYWKIIK